MSRPYFASSSGVADGATTDFICSDSTAVTRPSAPVPSARATMGFASAQVPSFFASSNVPEGCTTSTPSTFERSKLTIALSRRSKVDLLKVALLNSPISTTRVSPSLRA